MGVSLGPEPRRSLELGSVVQILLGDGGDQGVVRIAVAHQGHDTEEQ